MEDIRFEWGCFDGVIVFRAFVDLDTPQKVRRDKDDPYVQTFIAPGRVAEIAQATKQYCGQRKRPTTHDRVHLAVAAFMAENAEKIEACAHA